MLSSSLCLQSMLTGVSLVVLFAVSVEYPARSVYILYCNNNMLDMIWPRVIYALLEIYQQALSGVSLVHSVYGKDMVYTSRSYVGLNGMFA